jgi:hypothetical protein
MDTGGDHRMLGVEELTDYPLPPKPLARQDP